MIVSIEAEMIDYLKKKDSGLIVEGDMQYKDVETIWTFALEGDNWLVSNIEPDDLTIAYAKLKKSIDIEEVKQLVGVAAN
jgi:hypothetical protein